MMQEKKVSVRHSFSVFETAKLSQVVQEPAQRRPEGTGTKRARVRG